MSRDAPDHDVGYGSPPKSTRFKKGRSGNPKGRPRGRKNALPYEEVLGQMVTIREGGVEKRVTAAEAFILRMTQLGLEGDGAAARAAMSAMQEARSVRGMNGEETLTVILRRFCAVGSVNGALTTLRMATKLDRYRPTARIALEPWLVEQALARLGDRRLSKKEQEKVFKATRTPHKVQWPEWWEVLK